MKVVVQIRKQDNKKVVGAIAGRKQESKRHEEQATMYVSQQASSKIVRTLATKWGESAQEIEKASK